MKYFIKFALVAVLFASFFSFHNANAQETAEQVEKFNAEYKINQNGNVDVSETIVYNFGINSKHGIYRYIPVVFKNSAGTLKTRITNVTASDENGKAYIFETSVSGNDFNIKIGDPDVTVSGIKTYQINYTISRVINFFSDHDEFYWNVTGNGWQVPILNISAKVEIAGASGVKVHCFTGLEGSSAPCDTYKSQNSQADFTQSGLNPGAGLTIVVGFNKGLILEPTLQQKIMQVIIDNWIAFLPLVIFIFMFLLWFYKGRDPKTSSVIVAEYEAPDGLSPAEVAELVKFDEPSRGITAEIIQLAVLGYLKINHTDKDYELIRLKDSSGLTKEHQKTLLDGLFSDGGATIPKEALEKLASDFKSSSFVKSASSFVKLVSSAIAEKESKKTISDSVLISDLKNSFYRTLAIVKKQITKALMAQDYFPNNPTVIKSIYASITVFVIFFGFFFGSVNGAVWFVSFAISAIIILIFGLAMPKRTLKGSETYRRILGLKLYLNVAEKDRINFHNAPEKKPEVFEKLLPYAIALGVEKQWAKQFENIYLTPPTWYGDSYSNFNTLVFINSLNNFHSSSSSVLASSPSSRASSGGSGFSGGSSGGGFGGGGGGSW